MAYSSLDQTRLVAGKPVRQDDQVQIAQDLDDLNSRLLTATSAVIAQAPLKFEVSGDYAAGGNGQTGLAYERVHADITLIGAQIFLIDDGVAAGGSLQVDVKYKRGAGAWTSIFSTLPIVAQGGADLQTYANGILSVTSLLSGDILRLDVPQVMIGNTNFQCLLSWQKT